MKNPAAITEVSEGRDENNPKVSPPNVFVGGPVPVSPGLKRAGMTVFGKKKQLNAASCGELTHDD